MKYAIIIGNDKYTDQKLAQLKTPAADSRALAKILRDPKIGAFDEVQSLVNKTEGYVKREINTFLKNKKPDDLVLVYFSGHGVLDERGRLFLALKDTQLGSLNSTAIPSSFIVDEMDTCRSKRQILILDCCHSGAFGRGTKAGDRKAVTEATFEGNGYGRFVLTASDSTQYALEGDQVLEQTELSLFTHFLLEGLQTGGADTNHDGAISLDEWYEYAYARVLFATPNQVPHKWSYQQRGDVIIARSISGHSHPVEVTAGLSNMELANEGSKTAESGIPGKNTGDDTEGGLRQFLSSLKETFSGVFSSARSTLADLPPLLRIAGFAGIGIMLLWGGSLVVPGLNPPAEEPTATQPPPARSTFTVTPFVPTKTLTPSATATITRTPTQTLTPEPGYTILDKDEVFSLSPSVQALGELANEKYTSAERNKINQKLKFTINATADVPMFWRWYWCAATEQILAQNLEEIDVIFEADGRLIPPEQLASVKYSYKNQDGDTWWCFTYSTVLKDWKPGKYRFIQTMVLKSTIHDGKDVFPAGNKVYDYNVTISP